MNAKVMVRYGDRFYTSYYAAKHYNVIESQRFELIPIIESLNSRAMQQPSRVFSLTGIQAASEHIRLHRVAPTHHIYRNSIFAMPCWDAMHQKHCLYLGEDDKIKGDYLVFYPEHSFFNTLFESPKTGEYLLCGAPIIAKYSITHPDFKRCVNRLFAKQLVETALRILLLDKAEANADWACNDLCIATDLNWTLSLSQPQREYNFETTVKTEGQPYQLNLSVHNFGHFVSCIIKQDIIEGYTHRENGTTYYKVFCSDVEK